MILQVRRNENGSSSCKYHSAMLQGRIQDVTRSWGAPNLLGKGGGSNPLEFRQLGPNNPMELR